jgi:hypothetical protein
LSKTRLSKTWLSKTTWLAVFCLVGLGPMIAIKIAAPPASLVVEPAQDQSQTEPALAVNESAKSDRLELPARAEPGMIVLAARPVPAETPLTSPETPSTTPETPSTGSETVNKIADRHWRDANASIPAAPARRHPRSKEPKQSAAKSPPSTRAEVWHCRQDAVGGLLRSLDLSPRCNL